MEEQMTFRNWVSTVHLDGVKLKTKKHIKQLVLPVLSNHHHAPD